MAATGHKTRLAVLTLACCLAGPVSLCADDSADIHTLIGDIPQALESGDAALAMNSFSKSYPDYDKLNSYYQALTAAYSVDSQVEFTDEDVAGSSATVTVHWVLTLSTLQTAFTTNRDADITIKLAREKKGWRIVAFGPITIFDPQEQ
jgi:hypothetical protein